MYGGRSGRALEAGNYQPARGEESGRVSPVGRREGGDELRSTNRAEDKV